MARKFNVHVPLAALFQYLTQTVKAESAIVQEVTNVPGVSGHGAEGVRTTGCERVEANEAHVGQERPAVNVTPEVQVVGKHQESPQEIPAQRKTWRIWISFICFSVALKCGSWDLTLHEYDATLIQYYIS